MTSRIPARAIEGLDTASLSDFSATPPADGQAPVWDGTAGQYVPSDVSGAAGRLLAPLTTMVGGVPELVWDDNDNLVMTEVPA